MSTPDAFNFQSTQFLLLCISHNESKVEENKKWEQNWKMPRNKNIYVSISI